jgi:hypothetical protein
MLIHSGKRVPLARGRQECWNEAREAYLLEHAPGLKPVRLRGQGGTCRGAV